MTQKLYGLDDIPEGWELYELKSSNNIYSFICHLFKDADDDWIYITADTPQLALHRAIQKARGEA